MTDKEAMKMALEALELLTGAWQTVDALDYGDNAITALKERLADPMREVQRLGQEIEQEPVADRAFLERTLIAMEGVIDVADRKTDEFEALRSCVVDLTLMLHSSPQRTEQSGWRKVQIDDAEEEAWKEMEKKND